jgi:hypothetical protein
MAIKRPPTPKTEEPPEDKKQGGGQSKYDPSFCQLAIEYIGKGHTTKSFAGKCKQANGMGVSKQTVLNWRKQYPDFDAAMAEAEAQRAELIEDVALRNAMGGHGQLTALLLRNWSEVTEESTVNVRNQNGVSTEAFEKLYEEDPVAAIQSLKDAIDEFARIESNEPPL